MSLAQFEKATSVARENNFPIQIIGAFEEGTVGVEITRGARKLSAPRLESERFAADSWFATGISGYIELLKTVNVG
jgi:hypothetical protein